MTVILHLSDMHFVKSIENYDIHISKIVDALVPHAPFTTVIIIISGDITCKANDLEFKSAKVFINRIKENISIKFNYINSNNIIVLCVPGNHDVNHNNGEIFHDDLEYIYRENQYENELTKEIDKQFGYFKFSKSFNCFCSESVCDRKDCIVNNKKYSFFLLNSALFSLKKEEDKGFHYLNKKALDILSNADGDYNIAIMHHSPYCFTDSIKNQLLQLFSQKFSAIMLGHEHYDSKELSGIYENSFVVLHAGSLYDNGWDNSEFAISKIDDQNIVEITSYKWNELSKQYESNGSISSFSLVQKNNGLISVSSDYLNFIKRDARKMISSSFEDYFVFPRMECIDYIHPNKSKELKSETIFINELKIHKKIYISGSHSIGKTTLLKHIFNLTKKELVPLFITVDDFRNKKAERVIKNVFEETYGNNSSDYERFLQLPSNKKILLIDDIDCVKHKDFASFILNVENQFEYIVLASTEKIEFNWKYKVDQDYDYRENFVHYKLTPFFKDKRKELVSVLVSLLKSAPVENDELITTLCDALDSQKRYAPMTPDFIIQYVEYFCKNIGDVRSYGTNTFSKVFEANITNALTPYTTGNINVDKIYLLLSRIAYNANFKKEYPISEQTILSVITEYNNDYGNQIQMYEFISICKKSKLLYSTDNGYKFTNKNYLAYFVAKEVLENYRDTMNDANIKNIVNYCCFGINSDILLFIIYLSNNLSILNIILEMIKRLTLEWKEYDGDNVKLRYLEETSKIKQEFLQNNPEGFLNEQVNQEKETENVKDIQTIDIYDFDETEVDEKLNKIIKATSLLNLISRAFPNFEHLIKQKQKLEIVEILYTMPNKIFYYWASEIEEDCDEFIKYFLSKNDDDYQLNQSVSASIASLQNMSLSLLLDLYYGVIHESCKTNTYCFIDSFDHDKKYTYQIEYLMAIEQHKKDPDKLISLATKQISKCGIPAELSRRVLYHSINTMPKLTISQRDQMASKIGMNSESVKRIDIKRRLGSINN